MMASAEGSVATTSSRAPRWAVIAVLVGFGLLFAYDLLEAITNVVEVPAQIAAYNEFLLENDIAPEPVPWVVLIVNLLVPVVAFGVAVAIGVRRRILELALVMLVALAVVAALTLTLTALA